MPGNKPKMHIRSGEEVFEEETVVDTLEGFGTLGDDGEYEEADLEITSDDIFDLDDE